MEAKIPIHKYYLEIAGYHFLYETHKILYNSNWSQIVSMKIAYRMRRENIDEWIDGLLAFSSNMIN